MGDDQDVNFKLNLDSDEFLDSAKTALDAVTSIGAPENMSGLVDMLGNVGIALGTVAIAAFAFKEAIDLTEQADKIQKVQNSFQLLAQNAGISATELKQGMEEASAGLIPTNELLQIANQAIVKMGSSAAQLPEIMELARQATTVFGGDLTSNFQNISNAIANGNTRMLKQYGILIDTNKALADFAKANNLAVNEISAAGKSQAILNAALEQSKTAFAGINPQMDTATTSIQLLKTTFAELSEGFALAFDKVIGPGVRSFLSSMKEMATGVKSYFQSAFGDEATKAAGNIKILENEIKSTQQTIDILESRKGTFLGKFFSNSTSVQMTELKGKLVDYQSQLDKIKSSQEELSEVEAEASLKRQGNSSKDIKDETIHLQNAIKFNSELIKLDQEYYTAKATTVQSYEEIEKNINAQNLEAAKQHAAALEKIDKDKNLTQEQRDALMNATEKTYQENLMTLERQNDVLRQKMLTNYVNNSKSAFEGISRAFQAETTNAKMQLTNFGAIGEEVYKNLKNESVSAFEAMGASMAQNVDIGTAAANALKSIVLGTIGDEAEARGEVLLAASIWPPNPLGLAAGAGLLTLGGALKALSGSSSSSIPTASTTSGGATTGVSGGATSYGPITADSSAATAATTGSSADQLSMANAQANPQRAVNINIAGNYLDTAATQRQLMDLLRQETDATSYSYNKIGV